MEIRALRYFQTVAMCGSYSRGSELLHISQPAVSRMIRSLEEELGIPLFRRHGHGVSLTDAGQMLLERGQILLRQLEQTKAEIRGGKASPSGIIAFAIPSAAGCILVPALVERFGAAFPNVALNIAGGFSGNIHEWLVRGKVDLACVHDPVQQRGFEITPLIREEVYLVGTPGTFPFERNFVRTADLARIPLILPSRPNTSRRLIDTWIAQESILLNVKFEVDDHYISRALVKRGIGFTLFTRGAIDADLRRGELQALPFQPPAYWPLALITSTHMPRSDIVDDFIRTLRTVTRELVTSGAWSGQLLDQR
jgi:LysR family nitrogen assimilation transcriptional regulator